MSRALTLPKITIEANGESLAVEYIGALGEIRVQQRLSLPALCELSFYSPPDLESLITTLRIGVPLRVTVEGYSLPLFSGEVVAVEHVFGPSGEKELLVRGYDILYRLQRRWTTGAYTQVTAMDLARELVAELGIEVRGTTSGPVWQTLIQHRQSDLELLSLVAGRAGMYFTLRENELHMITLEGAGQTIPLDLGQTLLEARIEVNSEAHETSVSAVGWNPLFVEAYSGDASATPVNRDIQAADMLRNMSVEEGKKLVDEYIQDTRHAEALAQAELERHKSREVVLWGVAEGDTRLMPGVLVDIRGVCETLEGRYVLTTVSHVIDGNKGFISEISSMPPPPGVWESSTSVTMGEVIQVDDPDGLGRVRISLRSYGDLETDWVHVLSLGGGGGKGLLISPDVGDKVLVLCPHGDPSRAVVVGGLFGMDGPPESGIEGGAVHSYTFLTSGGQRIYIDDKQNIIRLENSEGSFIELSPDMLRLHAAANLDIEAPGKKVRISGENIDFERM